MALNYERIFNYLQNVLNLETITYEDEKTVVLSSNNWPISGKVYAYVRNRGGVELIFRYSEMSSACIISLDNSKEENTKEVVEYILHIANYNSNNPNILQWPSNCDINYISVIMRELHTEELDEVTSSRKVVKSSLTDEEYEKITDIMMSDSSFSTGPDYSSDKGLKDAAKYCAKDLTDAGFNKDQVQEVIQRDGLWDEETGEEGVWDKLYATELLKQMNITSSRKVIKSTGIIE